MELSPWGKSRKQAKTRVTSSRVHHMPLSRSVQIADAECFAWVRSGAGDHECAQPPSDDGGDHEWPLSPSGPSPSSLRQDQPLSQLRMLLHWAAAQGLVVGESMQTRGGLAPDRGRLRAHGKRAGWCRSWYGV